MLRLGVVLLAIATSLLVGATGALAATIQVDHLYDKAAYTGDRIVVRAAPGEANDLTVAQETRDTITASDRVPLEPGPGCEAVSATGARCTVRGDISFELHASLGDGDDSLHAADLDAFSAKLLGGPGDDDLVGPANSYNTPFSGGPGDDRLEGGHGWDIFREGAKRNGSDTFVGGAPVDPTPYLAEDEVDYSDRRHALNVSIDGRRNDGERRERDLIGADVERVLAGAGADRMIGNGGPNDFDGGAGRDLLRGGSGDDHLIGDQYLRHGSRNQRDAISGGPGDDRLEGGRGGDQMSGGAGHDSLLTGEGHDRADADDGSLDAILCGPDRDRVRHDASDFVASNCGPQRGRVPDHVVPLLWTDGGDRLTLALGCPDRGARTCTADVTLDVAGQSFGPKSISLFPGEYRYLWLLLGSRTAEHPDPPLDGAVLTISSTDSHGHVATVPVPLSAVHRDPSFVPAFLPLLLPVV
jgi:RTX calcium-binding nonapeptide repeat (4 copies)